MRNRFLRWDTGAIVDTRDTLKIPLRVHSGSGKPAPRAGYPSIGDQLDVGLPVKVDVTPRRVRQRTSGTPCPTPKLVTR